MVDTENTKKQKEILHTQIDGLVGVTTTDKNAIKTGMDNFYDTMPKDNLGNKEIKIFQEGGNTYMQTYNEKTAIDLNKKEIKKFSNKTGEYVFPSYTDLFASANLTNRLHQIFKDNTAQSEQPFHIDTVTGNIEFDNTKRYEVWKLETSAISGGRFTSKLQTVSTTLETNKQAYCDYLNTLKFWKPAAKTQ